MIILVHKITTKGVAMNKKKIILSSIIVSVVILMGIGTYAFFTADIEGNIKNNNIVQTTGDRKSVV